MFLCYLNSMHIGRMLCVESYESRFLDLLSGTLAGRGTPGFVLCSSTHQMVFVHWIQGKIHKDPRK